jgi:hypothetical protein
MSSPICPAGIIGPRLVWRAQTSAERVQASLAATYRSSLRLTARFFYWYRPALARRAMALSREHGLEADRLAAAAAGREIVGQDLIVTEICNALLKDQFWPEIDRHYEHGETCPEKIFHEMREFLRTNLDVADGEGRLQAALAVRSGPFSSHPSLAERLAALDVTPQLPDLHPAVSGASHFFGGRLDSYLERLDDPWRAAHATAWQARATWVQEARAEIAAIDSEAASHPLVPPPRHSSQPRAERGDGAAQCRGPGAVRMDDGSRGQSDRLNVQLLPPSTTSRSPHRRFPLA